MTEEERQAARKERLRKAMERDSTDPWPHYDLAKLLEAEGDLDGAVMEYGECMHRLPPRSATRPALDLAKLHQRRGNGLAAARLFTEVLDTFPADTARFRTNPDYREAALGLAHELRARETPAAARELEALEARYRLDFGGPPAAWGQRPPWVPAPGDGPGPDGKPAAPSRPPGPATTGEGAAGPAAPGGEGGQAPGEPTPAPEAPADGEAPGGG